MSSLYGDITKQYFFQFERFFSNRTEMDLKVKAGTDGVFPGRYVLVKYDATTSEEDFILGYYHNGVMYANAITERYFENGQWKERVNYEHPYRFNTFKKVPVAQLNAKQWYTYYLKLSDTRYIQLPSEQFFNKESNQTYYIPEEQFVEVENPIGEKWASYYTYDSNTKTYYRLRSSREYDSNTTYYILDTNFVVAGQLVRMRNSYGEPTGYYYKCSNLDNNTDIETLKEEILSLPEYLQKVTGVPDENNWGQYFYKIENSDEYTKCSSFSDFEYYFENLYISKLTDYVNSINYWSEENNFERFLSELKVKGLILADDTTFEENDFETKFQTLYSSFNGKDAENNEIPKKNSEIASWSLVRELDSNLSDYVRNYNIDKATYNNEFDLYGYDATIWQKVFNSGYGKYVLIARLNAVAPRFDIVASPPSLNPEQPYIDAASSSDRYQVLNMPSTWGFRIGEAADEEKSEQKVIWNTLEGPQEVDGDIYFNLKKAHDIKHFEDDETNNEIILEPTGQSGKLYISRDGTSVETNDILELGIHLPAIGNMVSKGYDLIYGHNNDAEQTRPRDIDWYEGYEPDEVKENGGNSILNGGKTHALNTIAGSMNTIHDRLGQVIINLNKYVRELYDKGVSIPLIDNSGSNVNLVELIAHPEYFDLKDNINVQSFIAFLDKDYIYTREGIDNFYRKGVDYNIQTVTDFTYINKGHYDTLYENNNAEMPSNYYYIFIEDTGYVPADTWTSQQLHESNKYLFVRSAEGNLFNSIEIADFNSRDYYTKSGDNYLYSDTLNLIKNQYYIQGSPTTISFSAKYQPNKFYKAETTAENHIEYTLCTEDSPVYNVFYNITESNITPEFNNNLTVIYEPRTFYYKDSLGRYVIANEESDSVPQDRQYYKQAFDETADPIAISTENGVYYGYPIKEDSAVPISLTFNVTQKDTLYYYDETDHSYRCYSELKNKPSINGYSAQTVARQYVRINPSQINRGQFFIPNTYYKRSEVEENKYNYSLAKNSDYTSSSDVFYDVNFVREDKPFFEPLKYYYKNQNDNYLLAETYTANIPYYVKKSLYVQQDTSNICPVGYLWQNSYYVPPSITLCYREEYPALIPMRGISNGDSSVHGTLLRLNQLINAEDTLGRNLDTFMGALNMVRDLMYAFGNLRPGSFVYVNNFGQLTSGELSYDELVNLSNLNLGSKVLKALAKVTSVKLGDNNLSPTADESTGVGKMYNNQ